MDFDISLIDEIQYVTITAEMNEKYMQAYHSNSKLFCFLKEKKNLKTCLVN